MVAVTAPLVIEFVMLARDAIFSGVGYMYIAILFVYYCYGILCARSDSQKIART